MNNIGIVDYPAPKQDYKVLVRCYTYNHSKYIEDALNGFAMQQTNFPFVCLVVDDASTDGEQDVINAWMERECDMSRAKMIDIPTSIVIIVPHKSNTSCSFAFYLLKHNLFGIKGEKKKHVDPWREKCEYEAMCEGDDYWIEPLKLQKQVDLMDSNPDIGLVHTKYNIVDGNNELLKNEDVPLNYRTLTPFLSRGYIYDKLFNNQSSILTCTVLFRIQNYLTLIDHDLFMQIAKKYRIEYIHDTTSCYRILPNSMMRARYNIVQEKLFMTLSKHMFNYYNGDQDINICYEQSKLQKEVDMFFSKYITYCIRNRQLFNSSIKHIFAILLNNPRLLLITPYNFFKRLWLSI